MVPVGLYWELVALKKNKKTLNPNVICPKTHYRKPLFNGFNG